jgi:hypothetical protein
MQTHSAVLIRASSLDCEKKLGIVWDFLPDATENTFFSIA